MSLTNETLAGLVASFGSAALARQKNADVRSLARITMDAAKNERLADMERAANAFLVYSDSQESRIAILKDILWPRARAIRNAISATRAMIVRHNSTSDDFTMDASTFDAMCIRECRLVTLLAMVNARSAKVGAFPISRADMNVLTSRFIRNAAYRHFTFNGGRDVGSREFEPADILQGAFIRALDNGDAVNGVPSFGAIFRHVQAERAHLTRMANVEYHAMIAAANGNATIHAEEWPEIGDKHSMRLIGTRNYPTLSQHRASLADMHRDSELSTIDETVTHDARSLAILAGDVRSFSRQLASALMGGTTLEQIADAMGLTVRTITERAIAERDAAMASGIDHSQSSLALTRETEREYEIDMAQSRHAETLRNRANAIAADNYANGRVFRSVSVPLSNASDGSTLIHDYEGETVNAPARVEREFFDAHGWHHAPDVIRVAACYYVGNPVTDATCSASLDWDDTEDEPEPTFRHVTCAERGEHTWHVSATGDTWYQDGPVVVFA